MVVAVTYLDGNVFSHFGEAKFFKLYEVENDVVISSKVVDNSGFSHIELIGYLASLNVDVLLCGGIGSGAIVRLANNNIKVLPGVTGNADEAVSALLNKTLKYNPNAIHQCSHHH